MSKCEACGGDGQIEYGAYRGDEGGPTRECKLCGGPKPVVNIPVGASIDTAVKALTQLGQAVKVAARDINNERQGWAKRVAVECNERLRRENEQKQVEAERSTNDKMNELIRRGML